MKILVTGAAGKVGSAVARELLNANHEVRIFERAPVSSDLRAECEVVHGDLTDRFAVLRAVEGVQAIAHLGAIADPLHGRDLELFAPNVLGTQHILAAAASFGIRRVVLASSLTIYGLQFQIAKNGEETILPQFLPFDESHPIQPADVYALSKQCNEATAATYTRRFGMATTCLRLSWVNSLENPNEWTKRHLERGGNWKNRDLWAYVERRDAARAFRLALETVESGHNIVGIVARGFWSSWSARELVKRHYPDLEHFLDERSDWDFQNDGFWDTRAAEQLCGWKSEIHWQDVPELADARAIYE